MVCKHLVEKPCCRWKSSKIVICHWYHIQQIENLYVKNRILTPNLILEFPLCQPQWLYYQGLAASLICNNDMHHIEVMALRL
jgi:hypothetical protein